MRPDPTVGVDATQARTGVHTLIARAGFVRWTVLVELALWPTVGGSPNHGRQATTVATCARWPWRIAVQSTGVGVARVFGNNWLHG